MGLEDPNIFEMAKESEGERCAVLSLASVHELPEQKEKLRQAKEEQFSVHFQDEEKGLARIKAASDPEEVWCSLGMCQCAAYRDDKPKHKPCKHIYKIALMKGLI